MGFELVQILVPLGICVALPVLVVWIVFRASMNSDNKRAAVLIEAIKANNAVDAESLAKAFTKPSKTPREILNGRLLRGCIFTLCGLVFSIVSIVSFALGGSDSDDLAVLLTIGLLGIAIGASFLIVYFVTRRKVEAIEADEQVKE